MSGSPILLKPPPGGTARCRTRNDAAFVASATVQRSYDDWLPALNVAFYPTDKIIVRGAVAKVMTRPTLGNLTPGGTVDGFNYKISNGNPFLDPFRANSFLCRL